MTQAEYDSRRKRLDDERKAGLELIEAAYQTQLRALDLVRMGSPDEPSPSLAPPSPPPHATPSPAPVRIGQLYDEVIRLYRELPEVFDRNDVRRALGYEPPRNSLFRVLTELVGNGALRVVQRGAGRGATRYSRPAPGAEPRSTLGS